MSVEHVYDIIYQLLNDTEKNRGFFTRLDLWFIPVVNPDGSDFFWERSFLLGRKNGFKSSKQNEFSRGVDLNRNFPLKWGETSEYSSSSPGSVYYRGPYPASEPEVQSLINLVENYRFPYIMIFHSQANSLLYPYTISSLENPQPDYAQKLAKRLAAKVKSYRQDKAFKAKKNIYPVDGTDQDYYYFQFGSNALLTEVSHLTPEYKFAEKILAGFRPLWRGFLEEAMTSAKILLHITDQMKQPLVAEVVISEISYKNGEKFYTGKNGYFSMPVVSSGNFNIAILKKGFKTVFIRIKSDSRYREIRMEKEN